MIDPLILITGASGLVGNALGNALMGRNFRVRAALRAASPANAANVFRIGDITRESDWRDALRDVNVVVHLVARTHIFNERSADSLANYRTINVLGTTALARQAAACGVRRVVFLSSIKVNGEFTLDKPFSESDCPAPQDAYGISKLEAEIALEHISRETGLEIVILRPPLIYGPGVKGNFLRLLQSIAQGMPMPLASIKNLRSLIYIGNLVDIIIACLEDPRTNGKTYLVSDGEDISTPALVCKLATALGVSPRLLSCPPSFLHFGAALLGKHDAAARLTGSLRIDSSRLRRELDWQPRFSLDQGLTDTAEWYHHAQNS